jgi:putative transposase
MNLTELTDEERKHAFSKYKIIEPYINNQETLKLIARRNNIPRRTLSLWVSKFITQGLAGLSRQVRSDKGIGRKLDKSIAEIIEALYLQQPNITSANIYRLVSTHCHKFGLTFPSYRTLCKIVANIPDDLATLKHKGTKAYKQKYDLLHIRYSSRSNEIWQADHVLMDISILNDKAKPQRPWLTIIIDDYSRAICGYDLSFISPSAIKTSLCLRHSIWRKIDPNWRIQGIPETLYTDHGSDFTSKHIEQVCIDLKIKLIFSEVGVPRGRGKIERFFRTLNQKLVSYINLEQSLQKCTTLFTLKQLDKFIYDFILNYNCVNASIKKLSPQDKWQNNCFLPQTPTSLDQLDLLLLTELNSRKVLRDGIHFQGLRYIDIVLAEYIGEYVLIRYNPSNITSIRVFHNNKFLCQPVCPELATESIGIKEIQSARNKRRHDLRKKLSHRKSLIESVINASKKDLPTLDYQKRTIKSEQKISKLKIYKNE